MANPAAARAPLAVFVVAWFVFALLRAPLVSVPLERDEGEYAYIAQRVLAGDVPYRDAFDQKPPGIFLAYLAAFAVFDQSIEGIRLFMYLWTAATAVLLALVVRRLADPLAAAFSVLVFAVAVTDPRVAGTAANTEVFMLLPIVASTYCLLRAFERDGGGWWFACGLLAASACWFKQVAVTHVAFVGAVMIVGLRHRGAGRVLRALGSAALGAVVASAPVLIYFALRSAWSPFVDAVFIHNLAYAQQASLSEGLEHLRQWLGYQAPSFAVFWLLAIGGGLGPGGADRRGRALLVAWLGFASVGVALGLQFRPHYFIQAVAPLAALVGVGVAGALRRLVRGRSPRFAQVALIAAIALLVAPPVVANRGVYFAGSPEATSRSLYGLNPFPESIEIAKYIRRTSAEDDSIFIVGSEPQIFFYAQRRSATRYIFFYPLTRAYPDVLERQRSVLTEVEEARPRYIVWVNLPTSQLATADAERFLFDETDRLIDRSYRLELTVRPDAQGASYEFEYGERAASWMLGVREHLNALPWIAVYRRRG